MAKRKNEAKKFHNDLSIKTHTTVRDYAPLPEDYKLDLKARQQSGVRQYSCCRRSSPPRSGVLKVAEWLQPLSLPTSSAVWEEID